MPSDNTLSYLKFDYDSHLAGLINRARSRYPGIWNDFSDGSFGKVLLDAIAWSTSLTAFAINRAAAENFVPTFTLRESAVRVGAAYNYQLKSAAPATVNCLATLSTPVSADVTIAKGTPVRTADNTLVFEVVKNYTITAGATTPLTVVTTFDPDATGSSAIQSLVSVTNGQSLAVVLDPTVDLTGLVSAGQLFRQADGQLEYAVTGLEHGTSLSGNNQIDLGQPWTGSTGNITAQVVDRTISLVQGQTVTDSFVSPTSTATVSSLILGLTHQPVIDGSVNVTVNNVAWTQVKSLYLTDGSVSAYQVFTQPTGQTFVKFGNGTFGKVVPTEAVISVTYRVGGGSIGNVVSGAINSTVIGLITALSNPVNINVVNQLAGSGGLDQESLEEARANIPTWTQSNGRAVTKADYNALASHFSDPNYGQVRYAISFTRNENDFLERNIVVVSAWTSAANGGLTPVTGGLKSALLDYLQSVAVGTDYVILSDGTTQPIPVSLRFLVTPGLDVPTVTTSVTQAIAAFVAQLRPGTPLIYSSFVQTIGAVPGVSSFNLATPTSDLYPSNDQQLFVAPDSTFTYNVTLQSSPNSTTTYTANLPVSPLAAWAFTVSLGGVPLSVLPAAQPGFALLAGANLDPTSPSLVNLLTGATTLTVTGVPGTLTFRLNPVLGYQRERPVIIYAGYEAEGDGTIKRQAIRAALRAWLGGFSPGSSIYATSQTGVSASLSNVTAVIKAVEGVTTVNRVSFDTASNTVVRLDLAPYELPRLATVYLNNLAT